MPDPYAVPFDPATGIVCEAGVLWAQVGNCFLPYRYDQDSLSPGKGLLNGFVGRAKTNAEMKDDAERIGNAQRKKERCET
jgi:hypothetical protein